MEKKRGQVTIFIIIGIAIIAVGILLYFFYPNIKARFGETIKNPQAYMQSCLEENTYDIINKISLQGGSVKPQHYFLYEDSKIEYLCYTNEYYKECVVQIPFIEDYVEEQIHDAINKKVDECFNSMEKSFEKRGYKVNLKKGNFSVDIEPKKVIIKLNSKLNLKKENTEEYDSMRVIVDSHLYEFVNIAQSILAWEVRFGDSETTAFMNYYPQLKVEKYKQTDGTTIYIISERETNEKFQFASRSFAWPPGYSAGKKVNI